MDDPVMDDTVMDDPVMDDPVRIAPAHPTDAEAWHRLWAGYCDFYQVVLDPAVTADVWRRILDPASPTKALLARLPDHPRPVGLLNYVLHENTWGTAPVCYLEDLFTDPDARGRGVGGALIRHLVALGRTAGWGRVYWHTRADNATARALYDRVAGDADGFVRYVIRL